VAFAAQGISQVGNFFEALGASRVGVGEALQAINRKPGASEQIIYKSKKDDELNSTTRSSKSKASKAASDIEEGGAPEVKAIVPRYEIDSSSKNGLKPDITGAISIRGVHFSYPTRPNESILQDLTLEIKAGETTAFVGPSGGKLPFWHETVHYFI
jgi:ABC-type multidrug transport system fused ATPase/permease subunit